jgi:hypothetical protein
MTGVLLILALAFLLTLLAEFVIEPALESAFGNRTILTDAELDEAEEFGGTR